MYYKCTECGNVTAFPKIKTEYGGCGYSESYLACDCCGGECEEAKKCPICENYYTEDEIIGGMCKDCFKEEITLENALQFAQSCNEEDYLLEQIFMKSEIIEILKRELKNISPLRIKAALNEYANYYASDFAEFVIKKEKEENK